MDFLEVSAKTVDDAITKACIDLGLSSDQLDIQVISEGSAGFLGLGSKPAVIQVRKKEIPEEKPEVQVKEKSAEKTEKVSRPKHAASKEKKLRRVRSLQKLRLRLLQMKLLMQRKARSKKPSLRERMKKSLL